MCYPAVQRGSDVGQRAAKRGSLSRRTVRRYVKQPAVFREDQAILEKNLALAREIGAQVEVLDGLDAVETIIKFARAKGITQIFIGHSRREGGWRRLWSNFVDRIIRAAEGIDVSVFPH